MAKKKTKKKATKKKAKKKKQQLDGIKFSEAIIARAMMAFLFGLPSLSRLKTKN